MSGYQYRVVSQREGHPRPKVRVFATEKAARRRVALLTSDKPWEVLGLDPEAAYCCSGWECSCGGVSVREHMTESAKDYPSLLFVRLERRAVGEWEGV